ncbi:MAG: MliC family protein [Betaproteobacteria bacterium]|jgi:putative lipoprotein|nr:MAG: MliC family protein [Betaproteobacteria bacterium]
MNRLDVTEGSVNRLYGLIAVLLLLAGCSSGEDSAVLGAAPADAQSIAPGRDGTTYVYECDDQSVFTARVEGEKAWLFLRSGTISLPHVEAASGAKYSDGKTTYWSKGESAALERPGSPRIECKNNRRQAIWEDAKLRGADFRATGNEPGWYMEISEAYGIVFVTNYGSDRYHFEEFETNSDPASRETIFKASKNGHELLVVLVGKRCTDSMSGEKFETTVVVTLNATQLNGCGRALH